ncbi:MAG: efflux RND transporter periplasmic adaptor subunit [Bacteroidota bacterium]
MRNFNTIIILLLSIILYSCGGNEAQKEIFLRNVKYQEVSYGNSESIRTFSGTAEKEKIVKLSFRNNGIITKLDIKLGQKVKKGQLLAKLDNVASRLSYEQAITQVNSAASEMNTAKLNLDRVRSLFEKGSASLSDFEAAKNAYKTAKEGYESAKRGVAIEQERVQYGYLYAPDDGIIAAVYAELDENVASSQTIGTLNSGKDMEIVLGIPESVINRIQKDMRVDVSFTALTNENFQGIVTEVSPAVDQNTAIYPVRIKIEKPSNTIKSGMAANVTFNFAKSEGQERLLLIPAKSVGEDSKGRFVYRIKEDTDTAYVQKTHIQIGSLQGKNFIVTAGLQEGEKIATGGLQTLLDGQKVNIKE